LCWQWGGGIGGYIRDLRFGHGVPIRSGPFPDQSGEFVSSGWYHPFHVRNAPPAQRARASRWGELISDYSHRHREISALASILKIESQKEC